MLDIKLNGVDALAAELDRLSSLRFDAVVIKSMTEIYNRAKQNSKASGVGTPVDTGELRISLSQRTQTVGYTKNYAPHVEYGHRTVGGGYVQGQHFLKNNVDMQKGIFEEDLRKQLNKF